MLSVIKRHDSQHKGLYVTLRINDSITKLCIYAECHYAECRTIIILRVVAPRLQITKCPECPIVFAITTAPWPRMKLTLEVLRVVLRVKKPPHGQIWCRRYKTFLFVIYEFLY
jgi:hypothetical protein